MAAWLKTHPNSLPALAVVSFDAEAVWHITRLYCAAKGNDGRLPARELHVAVARKITEARARRLAEELVAAGLWLDHGDTYELVDWLKDQPAAAVWDDDTQRDRWARGKALRRDRDLCRRIQQRDANLCRYCAVRVNWTDRKGPGGGTYDHLDPDGPNSLDNVVVACRRCNGRKKDRTPAQAGMRLLTAGELRLTIVGTTTVDEEPVVPADLAPVKSESSPRPDSLAGAPEAGTNQIGNRSGLDRPTARDLEPGIDLDTGELTG